MMRSRSILLPALAVAALLAGCSPSTSVSTGTVRMQITDAPATVDAVDLVVTQVAIHGAGVAADTSSGWQVLRSDTLHVDLLALRNGVFATLAQALVPAGHYTQIRLKIGAGSTVTVDGVTHPLTIPSGFQTGYKLAGSFDVPANGLIDLGLDFDAARSIHETGSGVWMLDPVVRVVPFSTAGAISGRLQPSGVAATIVALSGADTVGTTAPAADGSFTLALLPPGTLTVGIHPASGYRDTTITGVTVVSRQTTQLGIIPLSPQ